MDENLIKTRKISDLMYATVIFSIFNLLFLCAHFSIWGCITVVMTSAYYFIRINLKNEEHLTLSEVAGDYIGGMALAAVLLLFFESEGYVNMAANDNFPMIILVVMIALVIIFALCKNRTMNYAVNAVWRYLIALAAAVISSLAMNGWKEPDKIISIAITCVAVTFLLECIAYNVSPSYLSPFVFMSIIFLVMVLMQCFSNSVFEEIMLRIYYFCRLDGVKWYNFVLVLLLLGFGIVKKYFFGVFEEEKTDEKVYIALLSGYLIYCTIQKFSTEYDFAFVVLTVISNALFIATTAFEKYVKKSDSNCAYIGVLAIIHILPIAFFYGWGMRFVSLSVAVVGSYIFCTRYNAENKEKNEKKAYETWGLWQFVVSVAAVYGIVVTLEKCNFIGNYFLIAFLYLMFTFGMLILNMQNQRRTTTNAPAKIIMSILAVLLLCFTTNQSKIKVSYEVENKISSETEVKEENLEKTGILKLSINNKSKKVNIRNSYCYWSNDADNIEYLGTENNATYEIALRNGCLCVVCEDTEGIVSTSSRWFYNATKE